MEEIRYLINIYCSGPRYLLYVHFRSPDYLITVYCLKCLFGFSEYDIYTINLRKFTKFVPLYLCTSIADAAGFFFVCVCQVSI